MAPFYHPLVRRFMHLHAIKFMAVVLLGIAAGYFTLLLPLSIGKYLEILFASGGGKTRALQMLGIQLPNRLTIFFVFFMAVLAAQFLVSWAHRYWSAWLGERFVADLRSRLFQHQSEQGIVLAASESLVVYASDAKHAYQWMVKGCIGFCKQVAFAAMGIYLLLSISWQITLVVLAASITFFYLYQLLHLRFEPWITSFYRRRKRWLHFVASALDTPDPAKATYRQYQRKYDRVLEAADEGNLRKSLLQAAAPMLMYLLLAMVMLVIAVGGPWLALSGGLVLTYMLLLMTVLPAMRSLIKVSQVWLQGEASVRKYQPKPLMQQKKCTILQPAVAQMPQTTLVGK